MYIHTYICLCIYKYCIKNIRFYNESLEKHRKQNWAHELGKWQRLSSLANNVIDINAIC